MKKMENFKKLFGFTRLVKPLFGFTLAEVLITLSILGVVAAITVPSLIDRQHEREYVTRLKKEFSAVTEAYDTAQAEMGTNPVGWYEETGKSIGEIVANYLNVAKECIGRIDSSCALNTDGTVYKSMMNVNYAIMFGTMVSSGSEYELKDGSWIFFAIDNTCNTYSGTLKTCGQVFMDINGKKGPNKWGVDTFRFNITNKSIIPIGYIDNGQPDNPIMQTHCNKNLSVNYNGMGCTAWALYKGNMDYLRKTVSW